jgi:hypothetical protein
MLRIVRTAPARRLCLLLLSGLSLVSSAAHAADSSPALTAEERQKLFDYLKSSEEKFLALIEGVDGAAWSWKPAPERWSVGECAEHIVRTERSLFETAKQALAAPENPDWAEKTKDKGTFIERVMPDRTGRAQAPQEVRPTEGLSKEQVMDQFRATREELAKLMEQQSLPLKSHTQEHPFPVFGTLNAYQWVLYVPLHTIRHSKQIEEVKATAGYPGT